METCAVAKSDYEVLIREEYFPFWDEETKTAWIKGLTACLEHVGRGPDPDSGDHDTLCRFMTGLGLARKYNMTNMEANLLLKMDAAIRERSLCWSFDYFIAAPLAAREILAALARERRKGGGR